MSFASDLKGFAAKSKVGIDGVVRHAVVLAAQGLVLKSPVGNPDLWKVPRKGYVGGRLRASWNLGIGNPDEVTTDQIDPSGTTTIGKIASKMQGESGGKIFYVSSSLPYVRRIEYEGWSSQSPAGMARVTFAELPSAIERYVMSIRK